jgi:hypothetical protein
MHHEIYEVHVFFVIQYGIKGSIHVMLGSVGPLEISYISFF